MAFLSRKDVMLAYPAQQNRINNFPRIKAENGSTSITMFHQPKLNGERCRLAWFHGEPCFISSYGNEFKFLGHLKNQFTRLSEFLGQIPADGEIYVHGWSRERIDSALRRTKNKSEENQHLQFHMFDYQNLEQQQWERVRTLGTVEQTILSLKLEHIKVVEYGVCTAANWLTHAEDYLDNGYEGIMLRNPFGLYVPRRTVDLLKFKPTEQDEYIIIDVNEAISLTGENKGMVGSFLVTSLDEPESVVFNVGAGKLKHPMRVRYWDIREEIKGKMLIVKHELLKTSGQVPVAAVAVSVKE